MKITRVPPPQLPPPSLIRMEFSQEEARALYWAIHDYSFKRSEHPDGDRLRTWAADLLREMRLPS